MTVPLQHALVGVQLLGLTTLIGGALLGATTLAAPALFAFFGALAAVLIVATVDVAAGVGAWVRGRPSPLAGSPSR